ncbi:uncharacterized protein METZ01_LOCUS460236 [marine metagenome]|uniref:Uncharacterized protein n=1 Tax=marine metagenome TaxID=408172 RepID=A0A383AI04_9ZZZZ
MVVVVLVAVRLGVLIGKLIEQRNGKRCVVILRLWSMMRLLVNK